jgi:hypothetical protein
LFGDFKRSAAAGVVLSRGQVNPNLERRLTAMITCSLLMAGLLATADSSQPAEALRGEKPREEFVIFFAWQPMEKWQVEIREYQFRRGTLPELPSRHCKVEVIESQYRPDLRGLFEKVKNQSR